MYNDDFTISPIQNVIRQDTFFVNKFNNQVETDVILHKFKFIIITLFIPVLNSIKLDDKYCDKGWKVYDKEL